MLETTLVALQDISLDKIFDESGRKALCTDFAKLMQEVILQAFKKKKKIHEMHMYICSNVMEEFEKTHGSIVSWTNSAK